jgi:hypothetical protein
VSTRGAEEQCWQPEVPGRLLFRLRTAAGTWSAVRWVGLRTDFACSQTMERSALGWAENCFLVDPGAGAPDNADIVSKKAAERRRRLRELYRELQDLRDEDPALSITSSPD